MVKYVTIKGCDKQPCLIHSKSDATYEAGFNTAVEHKRVLANLYFKIGPVWSMVPGFIHTACKDSGLECPLHPGNLYNYTTTSYINKFTPHLVLHEILECDRCLTYFSG